MLCLEVEGGVWGLCAARGIGGVSFIETRGGSFLSANLLVKGMPSNIKVLKRGFMDHLGFRRGECL